MNKRSRKIYAALLVVILTAGYTHGQFTFGIRTGISLTNVSQKYEGNMPDDSKANKFSPGLQLGVAGEYALSDNFAIRSAFVFSRQGYSYEYSCTIEEKLSKREETITISALNYLQLPVHLRYKPDWFGKMLVLQAGVYASYGVSGKMNTQTFDDDTVIEYDSSVRFGNAVNEIRAFDAGVGAGVGIATGEVQVMLDYSIGMVNLSNIDGTSIKNTGLTLTFTCMFGKETETPATVSLH